jgi:hypothetical protein
MRTRVHSFGGHRRQSNRPVMEQLLSDNSEMDGHSRRPSSKWKITGSVNSHSQFARSPVQDRPS